jgi:hypothetical protein
MGYESNLLDEEGYSPLMYAAMGETMKHARFYYLGVKQSAI